MLPFLAAVPILWGAKMIYDYATDDDYETSTYSNKNEKKYEAEREAKADQNEKIYQDIELYKKKQIKRLKEKYDVDIKFYGGKSYDSKFKNSSSINFIMLSPFFSAAAIAIAQKSSEIKLSEKITVNKKSEVDTVSILENETDEIIKLIGELEVMKYESII